MSSCHCVIAGLQRIAVVVLAVVSGVLLYTAGEAYGDPGGYSPCQVGVRLIQGSGAAGSKTSLMSPELESVRAQLERLPFSEYRAVGYQTKQVGVEQEEQFHFVLSPERVFDVRVVAHQFHMRKIPVTVRWTDQAGKQLVATKLRILNGGGVVLGTDLESSSSLLISITCSCPGREESD